MSLRSIALSLVVCLAGCTADAEEAFRPAGAKGEVVARILFVRGSAQVRIAKAVHVAKPGFDLAKTDELVVKPGGFLVLRLIKNDYVVTVDEDLTLPVKDIALLEAQGTGATVAAQLAALVQRGDISQSDRVVGFAQGKRGAESGAETEKATVEPKRETAVVRSQRVESPPSAASPPPSSAPSPAPAATAAAPANKSMKDVASADRKGGGGGLATKKADMDRPGRGGGGASGGLPWSVRRGGVTTRQTTALPSDVAQVLNGAGDCLKALIPAEVLSRLGGRERVRLHVVGGRVARVSLGTGLPAPDCLTILRSVAVEIGGDGIIEVEVPLK